MSRPTTPQPPLSLTQLGLINSYVVPEEDGLTLIDAGLPGLLHRVERLAGRLGLPVRRVLLTHAHEDHFGSVNELLSRWPDAEFMLGEADLPLLRERSSVTTPPARLLGEGDRVGSLRVLSTPGHSPGHLAYQDERDGTLYAGDTFVNVPRLHVVNVLHPLFPLPTLSTWNERAALDSARRLSELHVTWLAVGHGQLVPNAAAALRRAVQEAEQAGPPSALTLRLSRVVGRLMSGKASPRSGHP